VALVLLALHVHEARMFVIQTDYVNHCIRIQIYSFCKLFQLLKSVLVYGHLLRIPDILYQIEVVYFLFS